MQTSALNALRKGWGILTLVGLANMDAQVPFSPWMFLTGRQVRGTYFGGNIELHFYYITIIEILKSILQ